MSLLMRSILKYKNSILICIGILIFVGVNSVLHIGVDAVPDN